MIERTGCGPHSLLRDVQVAGGSFQAAVPQKDLDGTQICARLQQMSSKAVAQRMGTNLLADASEADSVAKNHEDVIAADRLIRVSSGEEPFLGFVASPVLSQGI